MCGKSISIFLIGLFTFYLLTATVSAQKTMSIKELNTTYPIDKDAIASWGDSRYRIVSEHVIVSGFIRNIKSYEGDYALPGRIFFTIDDGTGTKDFVYAGGYGENLIKLENIKNGDKVFVEINPSNPSEINNKPLRRPWEGSGFVWDGYIIVSTVSKNPIPTNVKAKSDATPAKPEEASAPKTPGFEIVIGAVAVFFARKKLLKRR